MSFFYKVFVDIKTSKSEKRLLLTKHQKDKPTNILKRIYKNTEDLLFCKRGIFSKMFFIIREWSFFVSMTDLF